MKAGRMNPLDAVWLMMESPDTPMHVGVLATFTKPRNATRGYVGQLVAQMRSAPAQCAPWNSQLKNRGTSSTGFHVLEESEVDLDYHFRHSALPAPGGERELGIMISRLHSNALDRSRPLWEFHLIEGLEGDRFAFYIKVHHALVDNVNGIHMMLSSLDGSARRRNMPALWSQPLNAAAERSDNTEVEDDLLAELMGSVTAIGKAGLSFFSKQSDSGNGGTPRSTLNRRINAQRRIATQRIETSRIEQLAQATDSTVNEILAYLCSSSLRRFFKEYNALPDESLIAALPVSLKERSERLPGNAIAGLRVALGTDVGNPLTRLAAIKQSMQGVRRERANLPEDAATAYVLMRAAPIYASQLPRLGRLVPPPFNLSVSNTPGPGKPQYFNGARLESIYPLSPLMQFSALSIDCVSYAGSLDVGFTGARDTLPHLQRLAVYLGKALAELEQITQNEVAAT